MSDRAPSPSRARGRAGARARSADALADAPASTRSREPLDRTQVLAAALALVDARGLDALSMRRLGEVLGCDPMSIYRYTPNREALLDGVVELVMEELVIPTDRQDWQQALRASAHDFRRLALAHPHVAPLLVTRPLSTPLGRRPLGTLRPLEQVLALLVGAGFAPADALHVHRAYDSFVTGHVLGELQELVVDPQESDDLLRLGLHRLPRQEFPHLRGLASALAGYDGAAELDQGLDILLSGLRAQLDADHDRRGGA